MRQRVLLLTPSLELVPRAHKFIDPVLTLFTIDICHGTGPVSSKQDTEHLTPCYRSVSLRSMCTSAIDLVPMIRDKPSFDLSISPATKPRQCTSTHTLCSAYKTVHPSTSPAIIEKIARHDSILNIDDCCPGGLLCHSRIVFPRCQRRVSHAGMKECNCSCSGRISPLLQ